MLMKTKKYRYTGKDFDIKTAPTKVKDSADELNCKLGVLSANEIDIA